MKTDTKKQLVLLENCVDLLRQLLDDNNLIAAHDYVYRAGAAAYNLNEIILRELHARELLSRTAVIIPETDGFN